MMFRNLQTTPTPKSGIKGFYGINRKMKGSAGECVDCQNVDGDEFPCLRSVKGEKKVLTADGNIEKLITPFGDNFELCGVLDNKLMIDGEVKGTDDVDTRVDDAIKFYDSVVTVPNMNVYSVKNSESNRRQDYRFYENKENSTLWQSFETSYRIFLDKSSAKAEYAGEKLILNQKVVYLKLSGYKWEISEDDYFLVNFINKYEDSSKIYVDFSYYKKNDKGEFTKTDNAEYEKATESTHVFLMITEYDNMSVTCGYHNRLWGCSEDGREIRCSKLGELNNFSEYTAGAASSWFCEVGSDGKFTGIIPYNDALFAFKEACVHVVYGTTPQNFSLEKTFDGFGCIDGRSICVVNNALYWLGYNGVYRYVGNSPKLISEPLNKKYKSGVAFSDNRKVFFNLTDYEGNSEFLSFDALTGIWHRYTYKNFIGGFNYNGKLYAYTSSEVFEIYGGDYGEWSFESVIDYNDSFEDDTVTEYHVRAYMTKGSTLKMEYKGISESDWEVVGEYSAEENEMIKEIFTPRFKNDNAYQYRLSGSGEVYIYEMEKYIPQGGRRHSY